MAKGIWTVDDFWDIFRAISDGTSQNQTDIIEAIAQSEQAKSESYFSSVIDQIPFRTSDYTRIRNFLRDLYSTHKTIANLSGQLSDPRTIRNSDLDELFRSFGYPFSTSLRRFDEEPPQIKVNLFLDLVNLYKLKGTPRSVFEVLQYYGISSLDIYEFWIEKKTGSTLQFRGEQVIGTTPNQPQLFLPYDVLTITDPHWLQTQSQILTLDQLNDINLPSKTPYIGIQPLGEVTSDVSIIVRLVQDQYEEWDSTGDLPEQNAEVSELGLVVSLLELYTACVYQFNNLYPTGVTGADFFCYDGTNTNVNDIIIENNTLINTVPTSRENQKALIAQYKDLFYRLKPRNYLQNAGSAGNVLSSLNPSFKAQIDSFGDAESLLATCLADLANWVRNFVGVGYLSYGQVVVGEQSVFQELLDVVNFFKPYRARSILLEGVGYRNRILNSIVLEDAPEFTENQIVYDYITGNSTPCCSGDTESCPLEIDTTASLFYSRETYDCGSYHDIGAVTDAPRDVEIFINADLESRLRCPTDGTASIESEILSIEYNNNRVNLTNGATEPEIIFDVAQSDSTYALNISLSNTSDTTASIYNYTIIEKTASGFKLLLNDVIDANNYFVEYRIKTSGLFGSETLSLNDQTKTIMFSPSQLNTDYVVNVELVNQIDATASVYGMSIIDKALNGFTVQFSSPIDSNNYVLDWIIDEKTDTNKGEQSLAQGIDEFTVNFSEPTIDADIYTTGVEIVNVDDTSSSIYSLLVTERTATSFTVKLSSPTDSPNYKASWYADDPQSEIVSMSYQQLSEFRNYDSGWIHDCSHGRDIVEINVSTVSSEPAILTEDGGYLLTEDGGRLLLE
jgi:hypothetical protein